MRQTVRTQNIKSLNPIAKLSKLRRARKQFLRGIQRYRSIHEDFTGNECLCAAKGSFGGISAKFATMLDEFSIDKNPRVRKLASDYLVKYGFMLKQTEIKGFNWKKALDYLLLQTTSPLEAIELLPKVQSFESLNYLNLGLVFYPEYLDLALIAKILELAQKIDPETDSEYEVTAAISNLQTSYLTAYAHFGKQGAEPFAKEFIRLMSHEKYSDTLKSYVSEIASIVSGVKVNLREVSIPMDTRGQMQGYLPRDVVDVLRQRLGARPLNPGVILEGIRGVWLGESHAPRSISAAPLVKLFGRAARATKNPEIMDYLNNVCMSYFEDRLKIIFNYRMPAMRQ